MHPQEDLPRQGSLPDDLYQGLPATSAGREADNPQAYQNYYHHPRFRDNPAWPYLALCRDDSDRTFTWNLCCKDWPLENWVDPRSRRWGEKHISALRQRDLRVVELFTRSGEHYTFS